MNLLLGRIFDAGVETIELEESIREHRENLKVQQKNPLYHSPVGVRTAGLY